MVQRYADVISHTILIYNDFSAHLAAETIQKSPKKQERACLF